MCAVCGLVRRIFAAGNYLRRVFACWRELTSSPTPQAAQKWEIFSRATIASTLQARLRITSLGASSSIFLSFQRETSLVRASQPQAAIVKVSLQSPVEPGAIWVSVVLIWRAKATSILAAMVLPLLL